MAVDKETVIYYTASWTPEEQVEIEIETEHDVERLIRYFMQISSGMDRRRYNTAIRQINSLKKRMTFHPDNLSLTHYYIQEIRKIILFERDKNKLSSNDYEECTK